jgi:hypothetical protein
MVCCWFGRCVDCRSGGFWGAVDIQVYLQRGQYTASAAGDSSLVCFYAVLCVAILCCCGGAVPCALVAGFRRGFKAWQEHDVTNQHNVGPKA